MSVSSVLPLGADITSDIRNLRDVQEETRAPQQEPRYSITSSARSSVIDGTVTFSSLGGALTFQNLGRPNSLLAKECHEVRFISGAEIAEIPARCRYPSGS
jgi:hypothetical protein